MRGTTKTRIARRAAVPALLAASCALVVSGGDAAQAGGTPTATCPSGTRLNVVVPGSDGPYPGHPPTHIDAGFYGLAGYFWPPTTLLVCRTEFKPGHPVVRPGGTGCHQGAVPFQIPAELPKTYSDPATVDWGTFLPGGWYFAANTGSGGWATVCWYARQPANDGTPAGLPTPGTPAAASPAAATGSPASVASAPATPATPTTPTTST